MSNKYKEVESVVGPIKNESTLQRWEMFHRAIAHAKHSNNAALLEADCGTNDAESPKPLLSVVR